MSESEKVLRIVDANVNRAGEALRVVEECARFVLEHQGLANAAKSLRHRLRAAVDSLGLDLASLLASRDTAGDVGTELVGAGEQARADLAGVLRANFQRLGQSLRSLEEYAKLLPMHRDGSPFEALRYDAYTLEKDFASPRPRDAALADKPLMVLIDASAVRALPPGVSPARLEEMPAEEGFPANLPSKLAEFYERAGAEDTLTFQRFTDRARTVMELAHGEARRFNHEFLGTEDVLLGLVKEGKGVAATVLRKLGVDLENIRREVERIVQTGPNTVWMGKIPYTPRAKTALKFAFEEARSLGHNYVGTEHLLLGLLREQEAVAARVLQNLGLNIEDVREEVLNLLGADGQPKADPVVEVARKVLAGGCRLIELRDKTSPDGEVFRLARELRGLTRPAGAVLIINDRVDVAKACGADGVHLGLDDLPIEEARRILGPSKLIGLTAHTVAELAEAEARGADYVGLGTMFPSPTKPGLAVKDPAELIPASLQVSVPCYAIGGITRENLDVLLKLGATRVAVGSAITTARDVTAETAWFVRVLGK